MKMRRLFRGGLQGMDLGGNFYLFVEYCNGPSAILTIRCNGKHGFYAMPHTDCTDGLRVQEDLSIEEKRHF